MKNSGIKRPDVEPFDPKVKVIPAIWSGNAGAGVNPVTVLAIK
jgi:hypothetical protein